MSTIHLALWDRDFKPLTTVGRWGDLSVSCRFNAIGELKLTLAARDPKSRHLFTEGTRITADVVDDARSFRAFSGGLLNYDGQGPTPVGSWTGIFESDLSILWRLLCIPVPGATIDNQSGAEYDVREGPAETVLKQYVAANLHRMRESSRVVIAPDKGRGATIKGSMKFQSIGERLLPDIEKAGLGVSVVQTDDGQLLLDVYEPRVYGYNLSELDGTISKWSAKGTAPTATRVFAGGAGERAARQYVAAGESSEAALWGRTIEAYTESSQSDTGGGPQQAAQQALDAAASTNGLAIEVAAGKKFRVGDNVWLGDQVQAELWFGDVFTLPLRELTITTKKGLDWRGLPIIGIDPTLGELSGGPTSRLTKTIRQLARAARRA